MIRRPGLCVLVLWLVLGPAPGWAVGVGPAARPAFVPQASEEPSQEPTPSSTEEPSAEPGSTEEPSPAGASATPDGSSDPTAIASAERPRVWQWVLLGGLVAGALAALATARRRSPDTAAARANRDALLAQLQRLAIRARTSAPTDEEIAYETAVLNALEPLVVDAIARERDAQVRGTLGEIRADLRQLRATLRAARRSAIGSQDRARVAAVAGTLGEGLARVRASA